MRAFKDTLALLLAAVVEEDTFMSDRPRCPGHLWKSMELQSRIGELERRLSAENEEVARLACELGECWGDLRRMTLEELAEDGRVARRRRKNGAASKYKNEVGDTGESRAAAKYKKMLKTFRELNKEGVGLQNAARNTATLHGVSLTTVKRRVYGAAYSMRGRPRNSTVKI